MAIATNGNANGAAVKLTRRDFASDQEVRWCPGCGDYSILAQTQRVMPELNMPREKIVFVSGIGCSSRFPYYMNTYGFHTIHGRAPAIATGLKVSRPDLMVFVITGDGDALSIGGNHLMHVLRRNVDLNIVMFNNRIYGLTKGQYSPTSERGKNVKSAPMGAPDHPVNPLSLALGAEGTFVARTIDTNTRHLVATLERAAAHQGTSFVEVFQNCNIYNDGAFMHLTAKDVADDRTLVLEHGEPMIFGKDHNKGIRLNGIEPEVVTIGENGITEDDILVHDETRASSNMAYILSRLDYPEFPVPIGVLRATDKPTYDGTVQEQMEAAVARHGEGDLDALFNHGDTWVVEDE
ncbi:MAG: 2-oxoacid ferredoxin oxidoreductase subunit beta [Candidatus Entotheonella factor]|uniref:2-oxoacid ferredoxin oxidoreductase subunit beta n=2 Tax=Candidatus Entotheonella TaxID=93171 RepID=W4LX35_ENTF1|nr:MAG: 2-oxoacid ferredoxin oxidoreductase subunit beta [Candidatus Entotheonella factor]